MCHARLVGCDEVLDDGAALDALSVMVRFTPLSVGSWFAHCGSYDNDERGRGIF